MGKGKGNRVTFLCYFKRAMRATWQAATSYYKCKYKYECECECEC